MARRRPGRLLTVLGVLVILAGLIGALVLALAAGQRRVNAVEGLARAPVGCDTTLDFEETGEYLVFVERSGTIGDVRGNCDVDDIYSVDGGIDVVITVVDPDGSDVELDGVDGSSEYDVDGFVGTAAFMIDVTEAGDHVMRVESDDGQFVVAVGADPADGLVPLYAGAVAAGFVGVLVGVGMIVAGRRRSTTSVVAAPPPAYGAPFSPVGQVPQGPPTYTQPGGPVQYGQPPAAPPPAYGQQPSPPTTPPGSPIGLPAYQSPPPTAAPPPMPPPSTPQIPGEPTWQAPAPPAPEAGDASIPGRVDPQDDATRRYDGDDTPTIERPRWEEPPPPT